MDFNRVPTAYHLPLSVSVIPAGILQFPFYGRGLE